MLICKIFYIYFLLMSITFFILSSLYLIMDFSLIIEYNLLHLNSSSIVVTFLFDWMSLLFMSFVFFISSMVIFYSDEYMGGGKNLDRFIMLIILFVFSMAMLIISPNLISILLGWDGLGLVSYCLVIYYQNVKSYNAGMLTALTNRVGDVALLMSIAWMLNFGSWNFIYYLEFYKNDLVMKIITYSVILAIMTKSAQIPFSSWLPAAMAAPTPVSSLVHSSTLVTAGIYLLIRFNFSLSYNMTFFMLFLSSMTMFMSGLGANFEFDLKKIIALSTLSQLGMMMSILLLGSYDLAFFHLLIHALFKALLFMCAGNIIHNMNNCQDIRFMGGLINFMPLTCAFFNICNMSLCGLPFLSGFYSKDLIVEVMSMSYMNIYIYIMFYISIGLTVSYSMRLTYYSVTGEFNYNCLNCLGEKSFKMLKGMSGLITLVIIMGSTLMWLLFPTPYFICLPLFFKNMALFCIIMGMIIGYEISKFHLSYLNKSLKYKDLSFFLNGMWNLPVLSTYGLNYYPLILGEKYTKTFDQGWHEYYGGKNLGKNLKFYSQFLQFVFKNHLKIYFTMTIFWIIFLALNIL
uniref:NADH-ubiquinone oxidoreductase chain 5 n=1 Tax=Brachypterolus vestitus TaxID=877832 RepID=A0A343C4D1_9CUCU|nr:NADH dehydrogenase subunit 5 [Brachypterolus vestitus]